MYVCICTFVTQHKTYSFPLIVLHRLYSVLPNLQIIWNIKTFVIQPFFYISSVMWVHLAHVLAKLNVSGFRYASTTLGLEYFLEVHRKMRKVPALLDLDWECRVVQWHHALFIATPSYIFRRCCHHLVLCPELRKSCSIWNKPKWSTPKT